MIGSITGYSSMPYGMYRYGYGYSDRSGMSIGSKADEKVAGAINPVVTDDEGSKTIKNPGESMQVSPGRKSSPAECETCKERKYQDGSDEMVSFKSPSHISPNAAGAAVRAHEQEHVSNAYKKASQRDGKVLRASVSIKTAICPECGRTYVSGGETTTQIKYSNENNPYQRARKSADATYLVGANMDIAV